MHAPQNLKNNRIQIKRFKLFINVQCLNTVLNSTFEKLYYNFLEQKKIIIIIKNILNA